MNINALSHTNDPEVSRTAAITATGGSKSKRVMRAIIDILANSDPMTPDQIEAAYIRERGAHHDWPEILSNHFVQKRVSELKTHVLVTRDGIGRPVLRSSGRPVQGAQPVALNTDGMTALAAVDDYFRKDAA